VERSGSSLRALGPAGCRSYILERGVGLLGGEAVGGDGTELPGGELVEIFFGEVGGNF
jgi:hypothetical protein